ncbi:MAG: YihY family inner membrane protein [Duncaniella sp.]|nr:YihY family inner membrane protein [Duncaniella sp.]
MKQNNTTPTEEKPGVFARLSSLWDRVAARCEAWWEYCSAGVWNEQNNTLKVSVIKTVNLAVRTFMSTDLQSRACAMTYRTLLAIVPALALVFAIGRGFGFQTVIQNQLYDMFPSQHKAIGMAIGFVDSCLPQASEGVFVGVGVVFLLWTVVSLLDSVEESFNGIWGVTVDRSFFRKVTDYLAICIILPILMICSGGLQIFMSTAIQRLLPFDFLSPVIEIGLDFMSVLFGCLFFTGAYMLIPNARVKFKNALVAGIIAGLSFQLLQWIFLSGQLYVAKYNAIYGSFSFLPLMLIWMQLSWLITLAGALICYSAQNIGGATFGSQVDNISLSYRMKVTLAVLSVVVKRFHTEEPPVTPAQIANDYGIPTRLVGRLVDRLIQAGLLVRVATPGEQEVTVDMPVQPATDLSVYTVGNVIRKLVVYGDSDFIPTLSKDFPAVDHLVSAIGESLSGVDNDKLLYEL